MQDKIALIFDFDDTLAPDSISRFLEQSGVDVPRFWRDTVDTLIKQGWDPVPALMYRLIGLSKNLKPEAKFTETAFAEYGKNIKLFPGVRDVFQSLRSLVCDLSEKFGIQADIEFYVISSGIDKIIESTRIAKHFTEIWANSFLYSEDTGEIVFPKNIISFTDKTRYLFQIQKGLTGPKFKGKPFEVNKKITREDERIPFTRMIFVGDGLTDVPCFSLMQKNGGTAIAVYDRDKPGNWGRAWGFTQTGRATNIAPADYRKKTALYDSLNMAIEKICRDIALEKRTYSG